MVPRCDAICANAFRYCQKSSVARLPRCILQRQSSGSLQIFHVNPTDRHGDVQSDSYLLYLYRFRGRLGTQPMVNMGNMESNVKLLSQTMQDIQQAQGIRPPGYCNKHGLTWSKQSVFLNRFCHRFPQNYTSRLHILFFSLCLKIPANEKNTLLLQNGDVPLFA
jgi:hypothetical protein